MEDAIGIIIVAAIWIVAILGKLLSKLLSAGSIETLAKAGKASKELLESLASDELEDLPDLLAGKGKARAERAEPAVDAAAEGPPSRPGPEQPPAVVAAMERAAEERAAEERAATPSRRVRILSKHEREKRRARAEVEAAAETYKPLPVSTVPPRAVEPPRSAALVAQLRRADPGALREIVLLREVFGPPRALQSAIRPFGPGFGFAGAVASAGGLGAALPAATPPSGEVEATDVPRHLVEMYRMGMLTREQFDELCEFHRSRRRSEQ